MSAPAAGKLREDPYARSRVRFTPSKHGAYGRLTRSWSSPPRERKQDPISVGLNLTSDQLEDRRWKLTQQSWDNKLSLRELRELRWIEAKLNAEEQQRISRVNKERQKLACEKAKLLSSLASLVEELRNS